MKRWTPERIKELRALCDGWATEIAEIEALWAQRDAWHAKAAEARDQIEKLRAELALLMDGA